MKWALLFILLLVSAAVLAQQQADQKLPEENKQADQELSEENKNETSGISAGTETEVDSEPVGESGESEPGDKDKDFKPSEEISEDYPVPLPSDI